MDYRDNRQRWAESHQVVHFYAGQWCTFTPALTDVAIVAGIDTYKLSAKTFRDRVIDTAQRGGVSLADSSFADYAMGKFGGWWTESDPISLDTELA